VSASYLTDWTQVPHESNLLFFSSSIGTELWSLGLGCAVNPCLHWTVVICFSGHYGLDLRVLLRFAGFCIFACAQPGSESNEFNSTKPLVRILHSYICESWLKRRIYLFRFGRRIPGLHLRTSGLKPRGILANLIRLCRRVRANHLGHNSGEMLLDSVRQERRQ